MRNNTGLVSIQAASPTIVTGNIAVDWSQVTENSLFLLTGSIHRINYVDYVAKILHLASPVPTAVDLTGVAYVIVRDFTDTFGFPLINVGDLATQNLYSRALLAIDQLLHSSSDSTGEILVNQTAHGFIVGNVLRVSGSSHVLCLSTTPATATAVGIVSAVVNANSFKLVAQGLVSGLAGVTLTPGQLYYVRSSVYTSGGGSVNITDSAGSFANVGPLHFPILLATSMTDAFVLGLTVAVTSLASNSAAGLAAQSPGGGSYFLRADSSWQIPVQAASSIAVQHLATGGVVDWVAFAARTSGSIHAHLLDLNSRLAPRETVPGLSQTKILLPLPLIGKPSSTLVPAGATKATVVLKAGSPVPYYWVPSLARSFMSFVARCTFQLVVSPADVLSLTVETSVPQSNWTNLFTGQAQVSLKIRLNSVVVYTLSIPAYSSWAVAPSSLLTEDKRIPPGLMDSAASVVQNLVVDYYPKWSVANTGVEVNILPVNFYATIAAESQSLYSNILSGTVQATATEELVGMAPGASIAYIA